MGASPRLYRSSCLKIFLFFLAGGRLVWFIQYLVLFNRFSCDMSSGTFESKFESKLSLSSDGFWRKQVRTVLLVKNGSLGRFLTQAQWSAYGRMVAKATTTICRTVDDSFLLVIRCQETLYLWDAREHLWSVSFADELFLCRKFYHACMSDGVDMVHINPHRGFQRQLGGIECKVTVLSICQFVCLQWEQSKDKSVIEWKSRFKKTILSEQYFNLVGVLNYRNCSIVKLGFYVPSSDIVCHMHIFYIVLYVSELVCLLPIASVTCLLSHPCYDRLCAVRCFTIKL